MKTRRVILATLAVALVAAAGATSASGATAGRGAATSGTHAASSGIHKIRHVVVVMQENRSFDSYFGTYPGADGIPRKHGKFSVCLPMRGSSDCIRPYHDHSDINGGGPHEGDAARSDVNHGRMNGFVQQAQRS